MTALLEQAVATTRLLSPEMQDEIARMMLSYAGDGTEPYQFTLEEEVEQDVADREESRGDYASRDEIRAIWKKHGL